MVAWFVLTTGFAGGCASDLPVVPEEEGDGEPGSSGIATTGASGDSESGESSGTGIEPGCGNGIVEAGETCDEQGPTATCDEDCTPVDCGDGLVNEAVGEECDEGEATETCNLDCTLPRCGDGMINVEGEECDDGEASAFCDVDCTAAECGDGVLNTLASEDCDDAGASAGCDDDCTVVECGDGVFNVLAGEICEISELAGATCEGLGFGLGALACDEQCQGYETSGCTPAMPLLSLSFSQVKRFDFSWAAVQGAEYYQLIESPALGEPYVQLGEEVTGESVSIEMPMHFRWEASYVLRACNAAGCTDSAAVNMVGSLAEAVGYVKASNTETSDWFGFSVALSGDGSTLAVGAYGEDSSATGVGGDQADDSAPNSGAIYVFVRDGLGSWSQQAYVKASNTGTNDQFGRSLALSGDGNILAVGASFEDSTATGIGGDQGNEYYNTDSGAVYLFARDGLGMWSQQAYVKASNTGTGDRFGVSVVLSEDGNTLAVGAYLEDSGATGAGGNQADNSATSSGAVYVFVQDGAGAWSQQAYIKASNTGASDLFGVSVALSGDGHTLAVGANGEDSSATGIGGNEADDSTSNSGAVYVFARDGVGQWSQQTYVKPSNPGSDDFFGVSVALSGDGDTLAVGSRWEDSCATGIDGNQADNSCLESGAVYVFARDGVGTWSQQAYVKASNAGAFDLFGETVALSGDGNTLAVGAYMEDSSGTAIGSNGADDSSAESGAVYVFARDGVGTWSQQAYVKASNTGAFDHFGVGVTLSGSGNTLAVGADAEDSSATGLGGNQGDNSSTSPGAVYLY